MYSFSSGVSHCLSCSTERLQQWGKALAAPCSSESLQQRGVSGEQLRQLPAAEPFPTAFPVPQPFVDTRSYTHCSVDIVCFHCSLQLNIPYTLLQVVCSTDVTLETHRKMYSSGGEDLVGFKPPLHIPILSYYRQWRGPISG